MSEALHSAATPEDAAAPVYAATYDHLGVILWGEKALERHLAIETERLDRYPGFRVGWDHEAYAYDYLAEHAPAFLEKMKSALARYRGRLGVGSCTYGQPLAAFICGESNIRQLTLALAATEQRLGYAVSVYLMSEHAFHAQMPQLLAGCGFRGTILRTHFMMYGHNPEYDEPVGWWVGLDGSRIRAVPTYRGQAATAPLFRFKIPGYTSTLDNRILTDAVSERCALTLADFRRAFGKKIQPLVATRADDPRSEETLLRAHETDPLCKWVLLEDIFALLPEPKAEFRPQPNDFHTRMPWGYCGNWIWNRIRKAEARVLTAERLAAIGCALGGPDQEKDVERAWKDLLVAQHHDIQVCGLEKDARKYLDGSLATADGVISSVMREIAPRIGSGPRTVVFNPLPWERSEWVAGSDGGAVVSAPALGFAALPTPSAGRNAVAPAFEWQPGVQYEGLRSGLKKEGEGLKSVVIHDQAGRLLTPFYEVFAAQSGGFRLIRDRATGQDLLVPPKVSGTLAGLIAGRDCVSAGAFSGVRLSPDRAVLVEEGRIGSLAYRSEWTFCRHSRRLDWRGEVEFNHEWVGRPKVPPASYERSPAEADRTGQQIVTAFNDHEYKLRLRFYPLLGPVTVGARDLPFCCAETNDAYVEGLYWSAVSDGTVGLALLNRGLMGSVRENDGALSSVLAFSLPYVWGTRSLHGKYIYELGVLPFLGDWRQADLQRRALEYNFPFVSVAQNSEARTLGGAWTPFRQTGRGEALLSALYTRRGELYARFYEHAGKDAEVGVEWLGHPARVTKVNLRERAAEEPAASVTLRPWQVQTVRLETAR